MKVFSFVLVLLLAQPTVTFADDDTSAGTGNELVQMCNQQEHNDNSNLWGMCVSYIQGAIDGFVQADLTEIDYVGRRFINEKGKNALTTEQVAALTDFAKTLDNVFCLPSNGTREQYALVVSKYLADNPEKLNLYSAALVLNALHKA